jgi:hypothetical protein
MSPAGRRSPPPTEAYSRSSKPNAMLLKARAGPRSGVTARLWQLPPTTCVWVCTRVCGLCVCVCLKIAEKETLPAAQR